MRVEHQLKTFHQILSNYDGTMPLHRFLPTYFKRNKQMGSSDRRWASRYIYSYFRLGKALSDLDIETRLALSDFLCHTTPSLIIQDKLEFDFNELVLPIEDKIQLVKSKFNDFNLEDVFPFQDYLSDSIDKTKFFASFFKQPDLFIRIDAEDKYGIEDKLNAQNIPFNKIGDRTLALANATKLESVIDAGTYQVQDLSSQHTGAFFKPNKWDKWWDCCAASGGKSLLLHSLEPNIDLLVSDLRESVLSNLDERFKSAGIKKYQKKELNLLQNNDQVLHHYEFDGIIVDAPCTGAGTWGRTPEMLTFFDAKKIEQFASMQKTIVQNVVKFIKEGKPLIYITCSAFKAENEDVVDFLINNLPLKLEQMELVKGYGNKADTMFVARLIKV
jgi:16S rRNA (cytosine967-C5)-methyltransferase